MSFYLLFYEYSIISCVDISVQRNIAPLHLSYLSLMPGKTCSFTSKKIGFIFVHEGDKRFIFLLTIFSLIAICRDRKDKEKDEINRMPKAKDEQAPVSKINWYS